MCGLRLTVHVGSVRQAEHAVTNTRIHRGALRALLPVLLGAVMISWIPALPAAADDESAQDLAALLVDVPDLVPGARLAREQALTARDLSPADTPGAAISRALFVGGRAWRHDLDERQIVVILLEARTREAAATFAAAQGTEPSAVAPDSWRSDRRSDQIAELGYAGSVGRLVSFVGVLAEGATPDEIAEQDALALSLYLAQRARLPVLGDLSTDGARAIGHQFGYLWGIGACLVTLVGLVVGLTLSTLTDRGSREWWGARRTSGVPAKHQVDLTRRLRKEGVFARLAPLSRGIVVAGVLGLAVAWPSVQPLQAGGIVVTVVLAWTLIETWLRSRTAGSELARGRAATLVTAFGNVAGTLLVVAGVAMSTGAIAGLVARDPTATPLMVIAMVVLGIEIISWSRRPVRLAKRLLQPRVREQVDNDQRPPLLLLRSFQDDALEVRPPSASLGVIDTFSGETRVRFEEVIAWTAWRHGPLLTFGQPGTRLEPLGAARHYHDDRNWQAAIQELSNRANAFLLVVGRSPSLVWEIAEIRFHKRLARTVFVFPPVDADETARRVATLCAALDLDRGVLEPGPRRRLLALGFDETGTPTAYVAAGRHSDAYVLACTCAFAAVSTADVVESPAAWARDPGGDPMTDLAPFAAGNETRRRSVISWISAIALSFASV
jgi:hypothetical protein